jgi:hypothetical protein
VIYVRCMPLFFIWRLSSNCYVNLLKFHMKGEFVRKDLRTWPLLQTLKMMNIPSKYKATKRWNNTINRLTKSLIFWSHHTVSLSPHILTDLCICGETGKSMWSVLSPLRFKVI